MLDMGHPFGGGIIVFAGFWWWWHNVYSYFKCQNEDSSGKSFRSQASFANCKAGDSSRGCCGHAEFVVGFAIFTTGLIMQHIQAFITTNDGYNDPNNFQHIAMYVCGIARLVVTFVCYKCTWMPPEIEHWITGVVFLLQGPLLYSHIAGKEENNAAVHLLVLICYVLGGVSCFFEAANPSSIMASCSKSFLVALGGLWFLHGGGFILWYRLLNNYPMHAQLHFLAAYFTYDALILALAMIFTAAVAHHRVTRSLDGTLKVHSLPARTFSLPREKLKTETEAEPFLRGRITYE